LRGPALRLGSGVMQAVGDDSSRRHEGREGHEGKSFGERQVWVPVSYKGAELGTAVRIDLLIERSVVVEVKACEKLAAIHRTQLLTYLKLSGHTVGLLRNFNVELLRHGMRRVLNG
jgi:GxxExxY protein